MSKTEKFIKGSHAFYTMANSDYQKGLEDLCSGKYVQITNQRLTKLMLKYEIDVSKYPEFFQEIDGMVNHDEAMVRAGNIDKLTGLFTRGNFIEGRLLYDMFISRSREKNHDLSLVLMDIDHFKKFNDDYGHIQGDHVLTAVGQIINHIVQRPNVGIRYGGEEILAVFPETNQEEAVKYAEKIRSTVEQTPLGLHPKIKKQGRVMKDDGYGHATVTSSIFTYHPKLDHILNFYTHEGDVDFMITTLIDVVDQPLLLAKKEDRRNTVNIANVG